MAATADSIVPNAVITMTGTSSRLAVILAQSSTPVISCMLMSARTIAISPDSTRAIAFDGDVTVFDREVATRELRFDHVAHTTVVIDDQDSSVHGAS